MMARTFPRILALLALLAGAVGAALLFRPKADMPDIVRIEMARGRDQLILQRRQDTGQWVITSANDAPADAERIGKLVETLRVLDLESPAAALPTEEPLELRVTASDERVVRHVALWPGVARPLPGGAPFATDLVLPGLAPSAWSTLAPPVIDPATLVTSEAIRADGSTALDPAQRAALAADLRLLSAAGWIPARQLDWTTASYVQARRADGTIIEIQRLALADGRRFARLTSDTDPALRAIRFFAFPIPDAAAATEGADE